MPKQYKNSSMTFESTTTDDKKKARCTRVAIMAILLLIGVAVGAWFTIDDWRDSSESLSAAAIAVALAVGTASASGRRCERCWIKNLYKRFKRQRPAPDKAS